MVNLVFFGGKVLMCVYCSRCTVCVHKLHHKRQGLQDPQLSVDEHQRGAGETSIAITHNSCTCRAAHVCSPRGEVCSDVCVRMLYSVS